MAVLGLGLVGAAIGYGAFGTATFLGVSAAAWGFTAGSMIGNMLFTKGVDNEGPRLSDLNVGTATEGTSLPHVYGSGRLSGNIIWARDIEEVVSEEEVGGKGGMMGGGVETTTYTYFGTFAVGVCEGPIGGIRRIWADGHVIYDRAQVGNIKIQTFFGPVVQIPAGSVTPVENTQTVSFGQYAIRALESLNQPQYNFECACWTTSNSAPYDDRITIHLGSEDQALDPTIESFEGASYPAFRNVAYVVFDHYPLEDFGNRIPNLSFEVYPVCEDEPAGGVETNECTECPDDSNAAVVDPPFDADLFYFTTSNNSEGTRYVINYSSDDGVSRTWSVATAPESIEYTASNQVSYQDSWTGAADTLVWDYFYIGTVFGNDGLVLFDYPTQSAAYAPFTVSGGEKILGGTIYGGRVVLLVLYANDDYDTLLISTPMDGGAGWQVLHTFVYDAMVNDPCYFSRSGAAAVVPGTDPATYDEGFYDITLSGSGAFISASATFTALAGNTDDTVTAVYSLTCTECTVDDPNAPAYETISGTASGSKEQTSVLPLAYGFEQEIRLSAEWSYSESTTFSQTANSRYYLAADLPSVSVGPVTFVDLSYTISTSSSVTYTGSGDYPGGSSYSGSRWQGRRAEGTTAFTTGTPCTPGTQATIIDECEIDESGVVASYTPSFSYLRTPLWVREEHTIARAADDYDANAEPECTVEQWHLEACSLGTANPPTSTNMVTTTGASQYYLRIGSNDVLGPFSAKPTMYRNLTAASEGGETIVFKGIFGGTAKFYGWADGALTDLTAQMPSLSIDNLVPLRATRFD